MRKILSLLLFLVAVIGGQKTAFAQDKRHDDTIIAMQYLTVEIGKTTSVLLEKSLRNPEYQPEAKPYLALLLQMQLSEKNEAGKQALMEEIRTLFKDYFISTNKADPSRLDVMYLDHHEIGDNGLRPQEASAIDAYSGGDKDFIEMFSGTEAADSGIGLPCYWLLKHPQLNFLTETRWGNARDTAIPYSACAENDYLPKAVTQYREKLTLLGDRMTYYGSMGATINAEQKFGLNIIRFYPEAYFDNSGTNIVENENLFWKIGNCIVCGTID